MRQLFLAPITYDYGWEIKKIIFKFTLLHCGLTLYVQYQMQPSQSHHAI